MTTKDKITASDTGTRSPLADKARYDQITAKFDAAHSAEEAVMLGVTEGDVLFWVTYILDHEDDLSAYMRRRATRLQQSIIEHQVQDSKGLLLLQAKEKGHAND